MGLALLVAVLLVGRAEAVETVNPVTEPEATVGSYAVAPVRILGIPAISVAALVVSADRTDPGVKQRLCSGDSWRVSGSPNDLIIALRTHSGGQTQLVALTKGAHHPCPCSR